MKVMAQWEKERELAQELGPDPTVGDVYRKYGAIPVEDATRTPVSYPGVPADVAHQENFGRALVLTPKAQFRDIVIDGVIIPMSTLRQMAKVLRPTPVVTVPLDQIFSEKY